MTDLPNYLQNKRLCLSLLEETQGVAVSEPSVL